MGTVPSLTDSFGSGARAGGKEGADPETDEEGRPWKQHKPEQAQKESDRWERRSCDWGSNHFGSYGRCGRPRQLLMGPPKPPGLRLAPRKDMKRMVGSC